MVDCIVSVFGCSCEPGKCEQGIGHQRLHLLQPPKQTWLERACAIVFYWWPRRNKHQLEKLCPELRRLKLLEDRARRQHRKVSHIQARRQQVMLGLLRGEA